MRKYNWILFFQEFRKYLIINNNTNNNKLIELEKFTTEHLQIGIIQSKTTNKSYLPFKKQLKYKNRYC